MKNKRILMFSSVVLVTLLMFYMCRMLNPAPRNITDEKPAYRLSAKSLHQLMANKDSANIYVDQVIEIFGKISTVNGNTVNLENSVEIRLLEGAVSDLMEGDSLVVKGRCMGYDDLLEEVRIDQATVKLKQ